MSTTVCQNIQSSSDTPKSLSLKLNPPRPTGWGCIETLSKASILGDEKPEKAEVYVHPLVKKSASMLSEKSLEMCTENLGSETGTDVTDDYDIFSVMSWESEGEESTSVAREMVVRQPRQKMEMITRKKAGYESLPPPLTTMCGANIIRVQPHRENGRLVMMAVWTSPRRPSILAERSNGRLTMSLVEDEDQDEDEFSDGADEEVVECCDCEEEEEEDEDEDEEEECVEEKVEQGEIVIGNVNMSIGESAEEGIDGRNKEVGEKFGIGEFQRLSRCKEGGRGSRRLISWETLRVAT